MTDGELSGKEGEHRNMHESQLRRHSVLECWNSQMSSEQRDGVLHAE